MRVKSIRPDFSLTVMTGFLPNRIVDYPLKSLFSIFAEKLSMSI